MPAKQKLSQRKALRSAVKKGSLRRKTPAHPSPPAMPVPSPTGTEQALATAKHHILTLCRYWIEAPNWGRDSQAAWKFAVGIPDEMGAEARSAEPVQSHPAPWHPKPFLHRLWSKLVGR